MVESNKDPIASSVVRYLGEWHWIKSGEIRPFWELRNEIMFKNGLLI